MHDNIARIDQDPTGILKTFRSRLGLPLLDHALDQFLGHRGHMALGRARDDDHEVRHRRFAGERDRDNILPFVVIERFEDQFVQCHRLCGHVMRLADVGSSSTWHRSCSLRVSQATTPRDPFE